MFTIVTEAYFESSQTSMIEFFCENSKRILAKNNFRMTRHEKVDYTGYMDQGYAKEKYRTDVILFEQSMWLIYIFGSYVLEIIFHLT